MSRRGTRYDARFLTTVRTRFAFQTGYNDHRRDNLDISHDLAKYQMLIIKRAY